MTNEQYAAMMEEDYTDGYYHLSADLQAHPECWCYVIWSQRGPGKTYSALRYLAGHGIKFAYLKRTKDDVDLLCTRGEGIDLSPFKDINRDFGTDIHAGTIRSGLGGFWEYEDGKPAGDPLGYLVALSAAAKYKGLGLSEVDYLILDEFIPPMGEIIRRAEGDMLLDFYMTVRRDRVRRGRQDLKLILMANGTQISTPVTETLEIIDDMAEMEARKERVRCLDGRGILLHHIYKGDVQGSDGAEDEGIAAAMKGTVWARTNLGGEMAYTDFSSVSHRSLKRMRPVVGYRYKNKDTFIYLDDAGTYFACRSRGTVADFYDLEKENDQKAFWYNWIIQLRTACIEGRMVFSHYSMYDLIINYRDHFKL